MPQERLTWLAGEQFRIAGSDQRSFALLAARFPHPPAGEMFLSLAQGELHALRLLSDFATALGWQGRDLKAYEPRPLAQAYPACLAWSALFGTCSVKTRAITGGAAWADPRSWMQPARLHGVLGFR